ncbi:hypothetical protein ANANG_G00307280 [Anguilla anguilla]|uniref:Uncharacterized protein n=1 Tax=Anguilla anguilla TaxID=7936 RepID=A0A9D3LNP2_ANGAN|nr:hypothetical protein ANANG_G00307280 [Anguilla anguilla]
MQNVRSTKLETHVFNNLNDQEVAWNTKQRTQCVPRSSLGTSAVHYSSRVYQAPFSSGTVSTVTGQNCSGEFSSGACFRLRSADWNMRKRELETLSCS